MINISEEVFEQQYLILTKYVPNYLTEIPEIDAIYRAQSRELARLNYEIQDVLNQFNVDTATWGLILHEIKYGIKYNPSLEYKDRREIIKSAMRGRGTTDTYMIKNTAEAFSGGEVDIERHDDDSYFNTIFVGTKGVPANMDAFINMLETIKPAHLGYILTYTYLIWKERDSYNYTWEQWDNLNLTWDEYETYTGRDVNN